MSRQVTVSNGVLAERIRSAQAEADFTNEELARRLDVSVRLLQKWRAGTTQPRRENVRRLARSLKRPIDWFYDDEDLAA